MIGDQSRRGVLLAAVQWGNSADGGLASIAAVIERLRHYRAVIITNRHSPLVNRWRELGLEVHIVPGNATRGWRRSPVASALTYLRWFFATRRIIRQSGICLIHANDSLAFQLVVGGSSGRPTVLNLRDTLDPARPLPKKRFGYLFRVADHILFNSSDMGRRWQAGWPEIRGKWSATYSVVDRTTFAPAELPELLPPVVLISGVVCEKKNQLWFLQAVAPALVKHGIEIWVAGDFRPDTDGYSAACAGAAAPLGQGVRFLGYRSDVATLMRRASLIAVPSRYEGLMRTMIEAMAVGRPVVSTDVASASEMLDQPQRRAGAVVPLNDAPAMTAAILAIVQNRADAEQMGRNGSAIAAELFEPEQVVAAYETAYDRVIVQRRARA